MLYHFQLQCKLLTHPLKLRLLRLNITDFGQNFRLCLGGLLNMPLDIRPELVQSLSTMRRFRKLPVEIVALTAHLLNLRIELLGDGPDLLLDTLDLDRKVLVLLGELLQLLCQR